MNISRTQNNFSYYLTMFFTEYLVNQRNISHNTIKSYRDTFKILLKYLQTEKNITLSKISFTDFNKEVIIEFLNHLEINNKNSISTRNQRLACIHAFCKFVQGEEPIYINNLQRIIDIPFKKAIYKTIEYLTPYAIKVLLNQPNLNTQKGLRDLVIMSLLYDTGARIQELIDLTIKDIRLDTPSVIILHGKGNKYRQVPIMENTKKLLKKYIDNIEKYNSQYLFESSKGKKFTRKGICYIINKYAEKSHKITSSVPKKIHPHQFRHTKAMHLLQSGVNLIYIRDFLGHVDIKTTEIYAKYDTETKRKAIENAYPDLMQFEIPNWRHDEELLKWLNSL